MRRGDFLHGDSHFGMLESVEPVCIYVDVRYAVHQLYGLRRAGTRMSDTLTAARHCMEESDRSSEVRRVESTRWTTESVAPTVVPPGCLAVPLWHIMHIMPYCIAHTLMHCRNEGRVNAAADIGRRVRD